jgi:hypothetical protein
MSPDTIVAPVDYQIKWLIVGCALLFVVTAWLGLVYWITRKKLPHTMASLPILAPIVVDLAALRAKYWALIDAAFNQHQAGQITNRSAHQYFSITTRFFVYEAKGLHTQYLTLSDLRRTDQKLLGDLIALYYPSEFKELEEGSVENAATRAKEMIRLWS